MGNKEKTYSAQDLTILEGLEAVRVRPGMYVGSTGEKGLHHILWEIIDNAVDEAANGYAKKITVRLHPDGSASVEDDGRGMPVDINKKAGKSGVEVIFTQLHAGGKFNDSNYNYSGGLHGVGAAVTNALSEWLKVEVYNKFIYTMSFKSHEDKKGKIISGDPDGHLVNTKVKTTKTGTLVRFKPDSRVFETIEFNIETIRERLRETACLNKGLEFYLLDERSKDLKISETFKSENGLVDYLKHINENRNCLYKEPIYISESKDSVKVEVAIQHTDLYNEQIFSFVNNIPTIDGGTHDIGFKTGLAKFFNDYVRDNLTSKHRDTSFNGDDFRTGITAVVVVKMKNAEFEGQTKGKLGNPEIKGIVDQIVYEGLSLLAKTGNFSKCFEAILEKAIMSAKEREAVKKAKELTREKRSIDSTKLLGKLASCSSKDPTLNELFIVEGDSAGGSAKEGRDRKHQAILPLRGKTLNVEKKSLIDSLKNAELRTIITALGTGIGNDFDIRDLNFDKVIILSDADVDGYHIRCLLLTFFFRYMKPLVEAGHVYIGMPPLYKVYNKNKVLYAYDEVEREKCQAEIGRGYQIQRYKGLGEMNPSQLWETTLDPKKRLLIQVTIEDLENAEKLITTLMGDAIDERKEYIQKYANFNRKDEFDGNRD